MKELSSVDLYKNGDLYLAENTHPKFINEGVVNVDPAEITAINFSFKTANKGMNPDTKQAALSLGFSSEIAEITAQSYDYSDVFYFIGSIVDFDEIAYFWKTVPEEYKTKQFAVTYDETGNVLDCRVLSSNMHAVKSREELSEIYTNITGYTLPVTATAKKAK